MNDLLNLQWFSGDVGGQMAPVIEFFGLIFSCVITLVGFCIVGSSILKNSMHGLYASSPKFWDRVYEVKTAQAKNESGNKVMKLIGTITSFLLSLLPNIKALTDFENSKMDAKHYFMKAIPAMCVVIFIGVFIYLGYPMQVAGKFSQFGTFAFDMVMDNMDPEAMVEAIPADLAFLKYQTDNAATDEDKAANKIAREAASSAIGTLTANGEMTKEARQATALQIESQVLQLTNGDYAQYCDTERYRMTVTAAVSQTGARTFSRQRGSADSDGVVVFNDGIDMSILPTGVTFDVSNWYLYWTVTFTPKALKQVSSNVSVVMTVPSSAVTKSGKDKLVIDLNSVAGQSSGYVTANSGRTVMCGSTKFVTQDSTKNQIVLKCVNGNIDDHANLTLSNAARYKIGTSNCLITEIKVGGSSVSFSAEDGTKFSFGEDPQNIANANASGTN